MTPEKMIRQAQGVRLIEAALNMDDLSGIYGLPLAIARHLNEQERCALAFCLLKSLPYEMAYEVSEAVFGPGEGPQPPLDEDLAADARMWAQTSSEKVVKAYTAQGFRSLSPSNKRGFLGWVDRLRAKVGKRAA